MLIIKSIEIENFKIYKKETIDFGEKEFIILTGPNGYGKTSLIDAIEWCITGNIKRLELKYLNRCKTLREKERVENKNGILKNKDCGKNDRVKVKLTFICNGQEVSIVRERKEDTLECNEDFEVIEEITDEEIKERIDKLRIEDSFYKYNFLDMSKAYRFMETSRIDLKEQVSDFLKDRSEINILLEELNEKLKEVSQKINDNKENIAKEYVEKTREIKEREKFTDFPDIKEYPSIKAYRDEPSALESIEEAYKVENFIRGWGYNYAYNNIVKLKKSKDAIEKNNILEKIKDEFCKEEDLIIKFIKNDLYKEEKRNSIINEINELMKSEFILKKKFNADASEYELYKILKNEFIEKKKKYAELMSEIGLIEKTIESLDKGNKIIEIFTLLVNNKSEIITEYRDKDNINCPLCGSSESFATIEEEDLAKYSNSYLDKQEGILKHNIELREKKKIEAESIWDEFDKFSKKWIKDQINRLNELNEKQLEEWRKVKKFFELANKNNICISKDILRTINEKLTEESGRILLDKEEAKIYKNVYEVLEYLQYARLDEIKIKNYSNSISTINTLLKNDLDYNEFDYKVMVKKLTYLKYYISSTSIKNKNKIINDIDKKLIELNRENKLLKDRHDKLKEYIDEIGKRLKELEQAEFEDVGPYLFKIFNKIIKHTNIENFQFKRDGSKKQDSSGVAFLDSDENNIMNMFSEGQLGVFMISYFIGNILKRKNENSIETFFMDDITNCLDDINVLSFIDIIKYLIKDESNGMNQLFFATCNDNIEALFKNRMEGFDISYNSIEFDAVGRVKKLSN